MPPIYLTWKCDLDRSELAGLQNACKFLEKARNKATVQRLHEIQGKNRWSEEL